MCCSCQGVHKASVLTLLSTHSLQWHASAYAKRRQSTADPQQSLASTVVPPVNASGAAAGAGANVPNAAAMLPAIPADSPASTVVSSDNMPLQPATAAADPPTATAAPHAVS